MHYTVSRLPGIHKNEWHKYNVSNPMKYGTNNVKSLRNKIPNTTKLGCQLWCRENLFRTGDELDMRKLEQKISGLNELLDEDPGWYDDIKMIFFFNDKNLKNMNMT